MVVARKDSGCRQERRWLSSGTMVVVLRNKGGFRQVHIQRWLSSEGTGLMVVVVRYTYTKVIVARNDSGCRQVQWWLSSGTIVVVVRYNGGCRGGFRQVQV